MRQVRDGRQRLPAKAWICPPSRIYTVMCVGNGFVPFDCEDTIADGDHMAVMRSAIVTLVISLSPFFRT